MLVRPDDVGADGERDDVRPPAGTADDDGNQAERCDELARDGSGAAAVVSGPTVDEPSAVMLPLSLPSAAFVRSGFGVAACATETITPRSVTAPSTTSVRRVLDDCLISPFPFSWLQRCDGSLHPVPAAMGMRSVNVRS